jgi:beta-galactosidase
MAQLAAEPHHAEAALLLDYADLWALQIQPHRKDFGYLRHHFVFYRALQQLTIPCDIVPPNADLSQYKLILAPIAFLADEALAATLQTSAERGASILLGVRSGFKTPANRVTDQPLPGPFRHLAGATVTGWTSLPPGVGFDLQSRIPGLEGQAAVWVEALQAEQRSLVDYASGPYAGQSALAERTAGAGRALYLGFYPTHAQAVALLAYLANLSGLERLLDGDAPPGLVVARRGPHTLLLNFTDQAITAGVRNRPVAVPPRDVVVT